MHPVALPNLGKLRTATIQGQKTSWLEFSNPGKPLILFLHGPFDSPETFAFQISALQSEYHLVLPLAPGSILSQRQLQDQCFSPDRVADDLIDLIDRLSMSPPLPLHCISQGAGAIYGWHLAERLQERLTTLTLIGGLGAPQLARRHHTLCGRIHRYRRLATHILPFFARTCPSVGPLDFYWAGVRDNGRNNEQTPIPIRAALLVLHGKSDEFLRAPKPGEFEIFRGPAAVKVISGGHDIHREHHDQVNCYIHAFLKQACL